MVGNRFYYTGLEQGLELPLGTNSTLIQEFACDKRAIPQELSDLIAKNTRTYLNLEPSDNVVMQAHREGIVYSMVFHPEESYLVVKPTPCENLGLHYRNGKLHRNE